MSARMDSFMHTSIANTFRPHALHYEYEYDKLWMPSHTQFCFVFFHFFKTRTIVGFIGLLSMLKTPLYCIQCVSVCVIHTLTHAGVCRSCFGTRAGFHPGQVASLLQGHMETNNNLHSHYIRRGSNDQLA